MKLVLPLMLAALATIAGSSEVGAEPPQTARPRARPALGPLPPWRPSPEPDQLTRADQERVDAARAKRARKCAKRLAARGAA
jgi:hypothetical protein